MSVESHIQQLEQKHQALDVAISAEQRSPAGNDLKIVDMKRRKLKIKEEITHLSASTAKN